MATVFPYRWSRTEHLTLRPPCHGGDPLDAHQPLPWILLDVRAYIADRRNSTTAAADLGNGHRIQITIFTAPPPLVSYICAWERWPSLISSGELIHICNVLAHGCPGSHLPLPPELINSPMSFSTSSLCRDIAIVNGLLTIVSLRTCFDSDTGCWSWDLSTWSKPVAHLGDNKGWQKGFMVDSSDITVDATCCNVQLLPKLEGRPAMAKLQVAHPTLSLTDANVAYVMGRVDASDEKAVVLAVDMANKRLQTVSVYDAERIVDDFDYSYTQSTISQYFTTAAGVKGNLKRPLKFHAQYPHKRLGETISRSDNPMDLHEPLQLDIGFGLGTKDETEDSDNPMGLE
uniref:DUF1618 domain-containing protein n=1 Tax=Oryza glumipatula TaxID=40148 RepID=A0A0E0AND4_9ORYZ